MEHTTRQFSNKEPHAIETVKKNTKNTRDKIFVIIYLGITKLSC